jgi:hypothetical protein
MALGGLALQKQHRPMAGCDDDCEKNCSLLRPLLVGAHAYGTPLLCYLRAITVMYIRKRACLKVGSKILPVSNQKRPLDIQFKSTLTH